MDSIIQDVGCCWWSKLRLKGKTERQAVGGGGGGGNEGIEG